MAATDPTPAPVVIPVPDVPEPAVVAEAGVSTSEWKLALGFVAQLFAAGTADAAAKALGVHLDAATLGTLVNLEMVAAFVVGSYVVSRGIRKLYAQ